MVLSDTVLDVIRRELRKMSPDVKIDTQQIRDGKNLQFSFSYGSYNQK